MSAHNTETTVKAAPRIGRRVALAATVVGLCGAGVLAAPEVAPMVEQRIQDAERAALLGTLGQLEGVSLDAAIRAAEITRAAVQVIVLPLARLVTTLGSGALTLLINSLNVSINAMSLLHLHVNVIVALRDVLVAWNTNVTMLPIKLSDYTTADISSAETYLKALKQMTQHPHA